MAKTFDISSASVKETTIIELEAPDGDKLTNDEGEQLTVTVYGPGSKPFQKAQAVRNRAILEQVRKGKKKVSDTAQREMDAEFLASCTESFGGFVYKDFSPGYEMFKACYLDYTIGFISDQVNAKIGDWENFTKAS